MHSTFPLAPLAPPLWADLLASLNPAPLPEAESLPLDLEEVEVQARAAVNDVRGWTALTAPASSKKTLAQEWSVLPMRVVDLERRAMQRLRYAALRAPWATTLYSFSKSPRAVQVPPGLEALWPVLVRAVISSNRPELSTLRLAEGLWSLYRHKQGASLIYLGLRGDRFLSEVEAAATLHLTPELLRVLWPALGVRRTQGGKYAPPTETWSSREWLSAVVRVLAEGGHSALEDRALFLALHERLDMPDVPESTLHLLLRRCEHLQATSTRGL